MGMNRPTRLYVTVLVDERGRVVMNDLPWLSPEQFPVSLLADVLDEARLWKFRPAVKLGRTRTSYATVEYQLNP
jgi:hypothetical protein